MFVDAIYSHNTISNNALGMARLADTNTYP